MTERQIKLVNEYGPRFCARNKKIRDEFLYLCSDAASVLTDEEWRRCSKAIETVISELIEANKIVTNRLKEAGAPVR